MNTLFTILTILIVIAAILLIAIVVVIAFGMKSKTGEPGKERIPVKDEPRHPHAAQCDNRLLEPPFVAG